jgi:NitT/TauT family transport system ATP-binding protein
MSKIATPLLDVKNLSAAYRDRGAELRVVEKISFTVERGQFVCVLGPSGSGKSTLLRVLAGLLPARSGFVKLNGASVLGPQQGVGLVFQDANLMPWRTVSQNIGLPLEVNGSGNGAKETRIKKMLGIVGLGRFSQSLPAELSGGMAQRVAIGRALIQEPDLLLMDEPFGSLDAITRERMGEELLRIWNLEHKTIVMVTHDINEAVYLADRVLVLSSRPAKIKLDVAIGLPRPRKPAVRYSKKFGQLAAKLRKAIE